MTDTDALFMLAVAVLFLVYELGVRQLRCRYCGKVASHDDHCPYASSGLTGGKK